MNGHNNQIIVNGILDAAEWMIIIYSSSSSSRSSSSSHNGFFLYGKISNWVKTGNVP
jgi:hypothetical protein